MSAPRRRYRVGHTWGSWSKTSFHVGFIMRRECRWCLAIQARPTHKDPEIRARQLKLIEEETLYGPHSKCPVTTSMRKIRRRIDRKVSR